jgi:ADP-ribose pyrophosphatase
VSPFRRLGWVRKGTGSFATFDTHHLVDGGRPVARDRLEFPIAVVVVPLVGPDVVLVRQWRHGAQTELLELPAGLAEPGESPEECALRECEEETGLVPGRLEPLGAWWSSPGISTERIWAFLATDLVDGRRAPDGPEEAAAHVERRPFSEVVAATRDGGITDMKTVAAIGVVAALIGTD